MPQSGRLQKHNADTNCYQQLRIERAQELTMYDFTVLKQAGITPGLTAKIVGVSRVTASQWCNGHAQPHRLLGNKVHDYLRYVQIALDSRLLPLNPNPGRKLLLAETKKVIEQVARASGTTPLAQETR